MGGRWHEWTKEEYEFLRDNYGKMRYQDLGEVIGVSKGSINHNLRLLRAVNFDIDYLMAMDYKSHVLKPTKKQPQRNYTKQERQAIRRYYLNKAHELHGL